MARTVADVRRADRTSIKELLRVTSFLSLNRLCIERAAVETCKAARESGRPLSRLLLLSEHAIRPTRSAEAGLLRHCGAGGQDNGGDRGGRLE